MRGEIQYLPLLPAQCAINNSMKRGVRGRGGEGQKQIQQRKNKKQKQTHKIKCRERSCKEEAATRNNVI